MEALQRCDRKHCSQSVCVGQMGQAAIQAGVPVDVRLETPTHLSFQVPKLCTSYVISVLYHVELFVTCYVVYHIALCHIILVIIDHIILYHILSMICHISVGLPPQRVLHCCSSSATSSDHLQIIFKSPSEISQDTLETLAHTHHLLGWHIARDNSVATAHYCMPMQTACTDCRATAVWRLWSVSSHCTLSLISPGSWQRHRECSNLVHLSSSCKQVRQPSLHHHCLCDSMHEIEKGNA